MSFKACSIQVEKAPRGRDQIQKRGQSAEGSSGVS